VEAEEHFLTILPGPGTPVQEAMGILEETLAAGPERPEARHPGRASSSSAHGATESPEIENNSGEGGQPSRNSPVPETDDPGTGKKGLEVLELRTFASRGSFPALLAGLDKIPGSEAWPVSLLDGAPLEGKGTAGFHLHLVEGARVETLFLRDRPVGRAFSRGGTRHCVLGGLAPVHLDEPPKAQTREMLLEMEGLLRTQGMTLKDLVRTWFFLDGILSWYDDFNEARTQVFRDRGVFQSYVPASTGIGGRNHLGAALMASALAVGQGSGKASVRSLPSPLQCPAGDYGSNFSRAAEFRQEGLRRVLVSGTASIDPEGATAHEGDLEAQMELTFRVVEAILQEQDLGFGDVFRGNAYFRDEAPAQALAPVLEGYGLSPELLIASRNTVCREDLLFELEVEAVASD